MTQEEADGYVERLAVANIPKGSEPGSGNRAATPDTRS